MKERLRYWLNNRSLFIFGIERAVSLGSWCHIKKKYCKTHAYYCIHRRGDHRLMPTKVVLVSQISNHLEIAKKYREQCGAKLIGFDHGSGGGRLYKPGFVEKVNQLDLYVTDDFLNAKWWRHQLEIPVEVASRQRKKPKKRLGKYVFLMGHPWDTPSGHGIYPEHDLEPQLDLHSRIVEYLEQQNIPWIYKVHPDRIDETKQYQDRLRIPKKRFVTKRFEEIHHKASIIIHTRSTSGTFYDSLFLGKPVIFFETKGMPWVPGAKEWFYKRLIVVPWR